MRHAQQPTLLDVPAALPNGLVYRPNFLSESEEETLLAYIHNLDMPLLHFREHQSRRRGMSFEYTLPTFLLPLQNKVAKWLAVPRNEINEAFVQEYPPGYGIGWHRDRETPRVIGISLQGWARMRFRPIDKIGQAKEIVSVELEPRSAYIMVGEVATRWQHSVAPVTAPRLSITFRTLPALGV